MEGLVAGIPHPEDRLVCAIRVAYGEGDEVLVVVRRRAAVTGAPLGLAFKPHRSRLRQNFVTPDVTYGVSEVQHVLVRRGRCDRDVRGGSIGVCSLAGLRHTVGQLGAAW